MLDARYVADHLDEVRKALARRSPEAAQGLDSITELLLAVPIVPHPSTPPGSGSDDNPVVRTWGEKPSFRFEPKSHWDVGEKLGVLDFERASKLSGARFSVLFGLGARLSRALAS